MSRNLCLVIISLLAHAGSAGAQTRVSLSSLVDEAIAASPAMAAAAQRVEAAGHRAHQEGRLPDPMIAAGYSSVGNPLPGAGLRTEPLANLSVMASQSFPFPGTRDARTRLASRDAAAEAPTVDLARIGLVSRVKQAYYRLARTWTIAAVLERNAALLETLLQVSEGRYAVGQAAQQDVIRAQTELSILELQQRRLNQERLAIETELNILRGRPPLSAVGRPDDLEYVAFDHPIEGLIDVAREHAPVLRRDRLLIERAEAGVALARLQSRPDITVSGGYAYSGTMPAMFEARVDVAVPLRRERRLAAIAEQSSQLGAARSDYDADRIAVETALQQQYRASATASELARLYRDTVLPQARLALESSITGYENGAVDFLSVLTSFASVLQYETAYVDELTNFHVATSQVEEMTGASLVH